MKAIMVANDLAKRKTSFTRVILVDKNESSLSLGLLAKEICPSSNYVEFHGILIIDQQERVSLFKQSRHFIKIASHKCEAGDIDTRLGAVEKLFSKEVDYAPKFKNALTR